MEGNQVRFSKEEEGSVGKVRSKGVGAVCP